MKINRSFQINSLLKMILHIFLMHVNIVSYLTLISILSAHSIIYTLLSVHSIQNIIMSFGYLIFFSFFFFSMFYSFYLIAGDEPADYYLSDMFGQLSAVVASKPSERINIQEG